MTCTWSKLLKSNSSQFKSRFTDLYNLLQDDFLKIEELLEKASLSSNDELSILNSVFDFWKFSFSKSGDITAKENDAFLHSTYNPQKEAKKLFDNFSKSSITESITDNAFLFASIGLGYAPIEFSKFDNDSFFIIIEPNPLYLITSMCVIDWTSFFNHQKCVIITNCPPEQSILLIEKLCNLQNTKIITQNIFTNHEQNWYKTFFTLFERNKQKQLINNSTLEKFSSLWVKNSSKNIKHFINSNGINIYKNFLNKKIPSIVIAAGPSLQELIPYLKQIQQKAIFIAVDTVLRTLLKNNIEPDFVVLIDPQYYAACHLHGLCSKSSVLITESSVYPSVLRFNCRKKVFTESLFPLGRYFEQNLLDQKTFGKLIAGGSVSTSCFDFAKFIGSKEIYFAGLDLGYPKKLTHIKGSTFEEKSHSNSTKLISAERIQCNILFNADNKKSIDYQNKNIVTDSKMMLFAWWFESQIAKNPELKTFSLSQNSLKIPGVEYTKPENLLLLKNIDDILKISKTELIKNAENIQSEITKEKFEKVFLSLIESFNQIYLLAKDGLIICKNILKKDIKFINQTICKKYLDELSIIDSKILTSDVKNVTSLVFPTEEQLSKLLSIQPKHSAPLFNNIEKSKIIYEQIIKSIEKYLKYLK